MAPKPKLMVVNLGKVRVRSVVEEVSGGDEKVVIAQEKQGGICFTVSSSVSKSVLREVGELEL